MRLRSGQNGVPQGNVVPFIHKYLLAIASNLALMSVTELPCAAAHRSEYSDIQHRINHASLH
jgi:hypothetical protein